MGFRRFLSFLCAALPFVALGAPGSNDSAVLVDSNKAPIAGAKILFTTYGAQSLTRWVTTDATGHFQMGLSQMKNTFPRGLQLVEASDGSLTVAESSDRSTFTALSERTYNVAVTDASGRGIPGVTIIPVRGEVPYSDGTITVSYPPEIQKAYSAVTNGDGAAVLHLHESKMMMFQTSKSGFVDEFAQKSGGDDTKIQLEGSPSALNGRVFDSHGHPLEGIKIRVRPIQGEEREIVSDKTGNYGLPGLKTGVYSIEAELPPVISRDWAAKSYQDVYLAKGAERDGLDFHLVHGLLLKGQTVFKGTDRPFPNTWVQLQQSTNHISGSASVPTDAQGNFAFRVTAGGVRVGVTNTPSGEATGGFSLTAVVAEGNNSYLKIRLPEALAVKPLDEIAGVAVGPDGLGVPDAEIWMVHMRDFGIKKTKSDGSGHFVFKGRINVGTQFFAIKDGLVTREPATLSNQQAIELKLAPGASCSFAGGLTTEDGAPFAGAIVTLTLWQTGDNVGMSVRDSVSDAAGHYSFAGLFPGSYSIGCQPDGYTSVPFKIEALTPGATQTEAVSILKRRDSFLTGQVLAKDGRPAVGVVVEDSSEWQNKTSTDSEGRFRLEHLSKGDQNIVVREFGQSFGFAEKSGIDPVTIQLTMDKPPVERPGEVDRPYSQYVGLPAPELNVGSWFNSPPLSLKSLKGKIVVLDIWAIWCGPCVAALPDLEKLSHQYSASDVAVIGMHTYLKEKAKIAAFIKDRKLTYPIALDKSSKTGYSLTENEYPIQGIPTVVVIGRDGKVVLITNEAAEAAEAVRKLVSTPG